MHADTTRQDDAYVWEHEEDLDAARQTIRTTVEQLETSSEELKSSNEEMMSMNEEMQSANEELTTINDELQNKIAELNSVNDDRRNLIESTQIATVFLDSDLYIRSFTPEAAKYFRLVEHDRGRPFEDIVNDLDGPPLIEDCRCTLNSQKATTSERRSRDLETDLLVRTYPYVTRAGTFDGVVITLTDVTELRRYSRRLEEAQSAARLRLTEIEELYRVTPQAKALLDRDLCYLRVNAVFAAISHLPAEEHIGKRAVEILPQLGCTIYESAQQVFETGETVTSSEVSGPADDTGERPCWDIVWYPVRRGEEEIYAVGDNVVDVTRHKRMEAELRRLMRELQHRVKNMLANVMALINRARREPGDPRLVLDTLVRRIQVLANTHNLLTATNWQSSRIVDVLQPELTAVYGENRVMLRGPDILVNARTTLALGMAVHELATNAAKYGALSNARGRLAVSWLRLDEGEGEKLVIKWQEADGPEVTKPGPSGFGSRLVKTTIEGNLGGTFSSAYEPSGFNCVISIPYERATQDEADVANGLEASEGALR